MSDLVERLRNCPTDVQPWQVTDEAADLIEKLQAELESCQRVSGIKTGTIEQQDDLLNMYSERVEKYRKALVRIHTARGWRELRDEVHDDAGQVALNFADVRLIAREALSDESPD